MWSINHCWPPVRWFRISEQSAVLRQKKGRAAALCKNCGSGKNMTIPKLIQIDQWFQNHSKLFGQSLNDFGDPKLISDSRVLSRFQLFDKIGFSVWWVYDVYSKRAHCDSPMDVPIDQLQFGEQTMTWLLFLDTHGPYRHTCFQLQEMPRNMMSHQFGNICGAIYQHDRLKFRSTMQKDDLDI